MLRPSFPLVSVSIYCTSTRVWQEDQSSTAMEIVEAKDLRQITDLGEIESLCRGIVQDPRHAKQVRGPALSCLSWA